MIEWCRREVGAHLQEFVVVVVVVDQIRGEYQGTICDIKVNHSVGNKRA